MKKTKFFLILMISLLVFSCSDFLEEKAVSTTTADALYSTQDGIESLVNACYTVSRKWYGKYTGYLLTEAGTDEFVIGGWAGGYSGFYTYNTNLQGSEKPVVHIWGVLYKGINACNAAISRIPSSPIPESIKSIRLGEAHFLRALYYYHLVETFGPLPIKTDETTSPVLEATRSSVDDVYKLIFDDLDIALTNLDGQVKPAGGRVIKPAVEAFLSRLYLTRGMDQKALDMAKNVINNYDFKLNNDFAAMWKMSNSDANINKESIWFVNYTANNIYNDIPRSDALGFMWLWEGGHHGHLMFNPYYYNARPGLNISLEYDRPLNQIAPSKYLISLYNEDIDSRYKGTFRDTWLANNPANLPAGVKIGDIILQVSNKVVTQAEKAAKPYQLLGTNDIYDSNGSLGGDKTMYIHMNKFGDNTRSDINVIESKRDAIVFRLAEMYLIAAEASMNLNKKEDAANYINVVRRRAAFPGKEINMEISANDVNIDFILDERSREFAGEQLRWFDLKRTGKLQDRLNLYNKEAAINFKSYHYLRPIPQVEIDVVQNKEDFKQNPGYN